MKLLAALVSTPLLAGCGGGDSDGYTSSRDVAEAAGCTQIETQNQATLFATDEVSCHAAGYVQVDWFKDHASLDNFRRASTGSGFVILYGPDWAISCIDNKDDCSAFKDKLGGSLE